MTVHAAQDIPRISVSDRDGDCRIVVEGPWTIRNSEAMEQAVGEFATPRAKTVRLDLSQLKGLDTAGAWLIHRLQADIEFHGGRVERTGVRSSYEALIGEVEQHHPPAWKPERHPLSLLGILEKTGREVVDVGGDIKAVLHIVGSLVSVLSGVFLRPRSLRLVSVATQFDRACIGAVPIVLLMSFLIGAIISQQGGFYLRQFGADIYVVDLAGVLVLREIGVILTAIMVAGRSGSAFTAEIGSMKMREEIDAMRTLGLDPMDMLVVPRVLALIVALPLLTFVANIMGLIGGGVVVQLMLDMSPGVYIQRVQEAVGFWTFGVGIVKAPFMAATIALVGCRAGMSVTGSAESVGAQTTRSVVRSIFLVIILDALFAMFFTAVDI